MKCPLQESDPWTAQRLLRVDSVGPSCASSQAALPLGAQWDGFTLHVAEEGVDDGARTPPGGGGGSGTYPGSLDFCTLDFYHSMSSFFPQRKRILLTRDKSTRTELRGTAPSFMRNGVQPGCGVWPKAPDILSSRGCSDPPHRADQNKVDRSFSPERMRGCPLGSSRAQHKGCRH